MKTNVGQRFEYKLIKRTCVCILYIIVLRKTKKYTDTKTNDIWRRDGEKKNREIVLCVIAFNVSCRYLLVAAAAAVLFSLTIFALSRRDETRHENRNGKERITTNRCSFWRDRFFNKLCENFVIYWSLRWTYENIPIRFKISLLTSMHNFGSFIPLSFFFFLALIVVFIQNLTRENKWRNNRIQKNLERKTKSISKKVVFFCWQFSTCKRFWTKVNCMFSFSVFIANCDLFK